MKISQNGKMKKEGGFKMGLGKIWVKVLSVFVLGIFLFSNTCFAVPVVGLANAAAQVKDNMALPSMLRGKEISPQGQVDAKQQFTSLLATMAQAAAVKGEISLEELANFYLDIANKSENADVIAQAETFQQTVLGSKAKIIKLGDNAIRVTNEKGDVFLYSMDQASGTISVRKVNPARGGMASYANGLSALNTPADQLTEGEIQGLMMVVDAGLTADEATDEGRAKKANGVLAVALLAKVLGSDKYAGALTEMQGFLGGRKAGQLGETNATDQRKFDVGVEETKPMEAAIAKAAETTTQKTAAAQAPVIKVDKKLLQAAETDETAQLEAMKIAKAALPADQHANLETMGAKGVLKFVQNVMSDAVAKILENLGKTLVSFHSLAETLGVATKATKNELVDVIQAKSAEGIKTVLHFSDIFNVLEGDTVVLKANADLAFQDLGKSSIKEGAINIIGAGQYIDKARESLELSVPGIGNKVKMYPGQEDKVERADEEELNIIYSSDNQVLSTRLSKDIATYIKIRNFSQKTDLLQLLITTAKGLNQTQLQEIQDKGAIELQAVDINEKAFTEMMDEYEKVVELLKQA